MRRLEVAQNCIYSRRARSRISFDGGWMTMMFVATDGALAIFGSKAIVPVLGLVLAAFVAQNRQVRRRVIEFGQMLRPRLEDRHGKELGSALHVGIAPGKKVQHYSGDSSWDVGFAVIDGDLEYYGDQCSFSLARSQVRSMSVCRSIRSWFMPYLLVEYAPAGQASSQWLMIEARDSLTNTGAFVALHRLRTKLMLLPTTQPNARTLPLLTSLNNHAL